VKIKSIGTKIIIPIVLIILVSEAITVEVVRWSFLKTLTVALKEKGISVCRHLAVASLEPILVDDGLYLQQLLNENKRSVNDLSYAFVTDADDNILAHTFSQGFPLHLLWANRVESDQKISVQFLEIEGGLIYDFAVPILLDSKTIGTARVGLSQKFMKSALTNITAISIVIILSVLVVGILIAIGLTKIIVKPIESLHHSTEIIGAGDLEHRIMIKTGDEIEQLANSFNEMVAELARYRDHLEELVKERTDELRESERSLAEAQRIAHLGNWDWNMITGDLFWSDEIYRIFGLKPQEFGANYDAFLNSVHPDDREAVQEAVNRAVAGSNATYSIDHRVVRLDDSERFVHEQGEVIFDDTGKAIRMVGTVLDITERAWAEEALRNTQAQLAQSEKMASLGMLVAGVTHEINTPAGAVNSMHNTLMRAVRRLKSACLATDTRDASANEEANKLFETIEDANRVITSGMKRVINIIDRLKSFAHLDEAELQKVDIHKGIEDVLTIMEHDLKQKAVMVRNFGDIPPIQCYPGQLNQVYLNLLNNAIEAIKDRGKITITTFQKGEHVYIQFKDTGVGIPKEVLKTIFDPGYTTKGVGVGTALGLPICYQIVKAHNGKILVESEVGKGTTFTIILPMR
jgi:PAS domain S-box-containing protein